MKCVSFGLALSPRNLSRTVSTFWQRRKSHVGPFGRLGLGVLRPKQRARNVSGNWGNYVNANDDYRNAWPAIAQGLTGLPIVNAGVAGQGVFGAASSLDAEVLTLQGITDCVVLIGTNKIDIPPGDAHYTIKTSRTLPARTPPRWKLRGEASSMNIGRHRFPLSAW